MKEITRRLYTKPVMLGMAFLMGLALVVGLFVTSKSNAAPNSFPVAAGNDEFETAGDGTTFHNFAGSPIPANFFGTGSLAYGGQVILQGVPLGPGSNVDTIIQRTQAVNGPGGSTPIAMTALSLKGTGPITVTYSNNTTEQWNVKVGLSDYKASGGTMTINFSTFDSTLKVWPKFTFTRVSDGLTKVYDTGGSGLTAAQADSLAASDSAADQSDAVVVIEPAPLPAPCPVATISDSRLSASMATTAAAASTCAPVTLSSVNSPWGPCAPGTFCITVPITEEERWAKHRPGPKGFIQQGGVAE
jgi:hypothetical protein